MRFSQACVGQQRLQKSTLLGYLSSSLDTTRVIVLATGRVISVEGLPLATVQGNINAGVWAYYENLLPRRMLIINQNWYIQSFDPESRIACVVMSNKTGTRNMTFTLNPIVFQ